MSVVEQPRYTVLDGGVLCPAPEIVAAHEAGHATVYLSCGIPVDYVERITVRVPGATRFGWTNALEDLWVASSPLPQERKTLRRLLGKAGGLAGELVANAFDSNYSLRGANDDVKQIGGALRDLGLLGLADVETPGQSIRTAISEAVAVIKQHAESFHELRRLLVLGGRVTPSTPTTELWGEHDDRRLLDGLRSAAQTR